MKVIGIIPARYGSTRLEGKPLKDICGKPMVQLVYEAAQKARLLDEVYVATDDQRIVSAVEQFGGQARLTSPYHNTGTDRVAEVAAGLDADIIVNVQGDEPLFDPAMIDEVVQPFLEDPDLVQAVEAQIENGTSAGWAWQQTIEERMAELKQVDDPLIAARAVDLGDVGSRVLSLLAHRIDEGPLMPSEPVILLAEDLTPSDTAGLDPAVREVTRTRLFAERAMFTFQHMPFLLRWQTELLTIAPFQPGITIRVRVCPAKPGLSVVQPGVDRRVWLALFLWLALLLMGSADLLGYLH